MSSTSYSKLDVKSRRMCCAEGPVDLDCSEKGEKQKEKENKTLQMGHHVKVRRWSLSA